MIRTTVKIDGMTCVMCEAHICETIRRAMPSAGKVAASRKRGEASFVTEESIDENVLRAAIGASGYTCRAIGSAPYEKRRLFVRK